MEVDLVERELKLKLPKTFSLAGLGSRLNGYIVAPAKLWRLHTIYYDTDDLRLARWGCSLRYRHPDGWTLKLPVPHELRDALARAEHEFPGGPGAIPERALELATAYLRGVVPHAVVELRTLRLSRRLRAPDGSDLAEVVEDDVRVVNGNHVVSRFRQLEIELAAGVPDDTLAMLQALLRSQGAGKPDATPKNVLALGTPAREPPIAVPMIESQAQAGDVFRVAFATATERLVRSDAALRTATDDPESVHQARVTVRQVRSHLRTFRLILDARWAQGLDERLRWLGDGLAAARNADVMLANLRHCAQTLPAADASQFERVLVVIEGDRAAAYHRLGEMVREPQYVPLLEAIVEAAQRPCIR